MSSAFSIQPEECGQNKTDSIVAKATFRLILGADKSQDGGISHIGLILNPVVNKIASNLINDLKLSSYQ